MRGRTDLSDAQMKMHSLASEYVFPAQSFLCLGVEEQPGPVISLILADTEYGAIASIGSTHRPQRYDLLTYASGPASSSSRTRHHISWDRASQQLQNIVQNELSNRS